MTQGIDPLALLCRNAVDVIDKAQLGDRLAQAAKEKRPLRVKAGFDPSAPDIHLGHTVLLRKLRQFQDLGHKVVLIIGDFTALIGDPTGKTAARRPLSVDEVEHNAQTYQAQAFKILDKDAKKIEIVRNSAWLGRMALGDFVGKVAAHMTVARVLERDDFQKRMAENRPLSVREFLYPLFQGYDSVEVKADVELGGTDQKFNLLAGRDLQRAFGQTPQIVMTFPLLVGRDGTQKMSKSLDNYIGVTDSPKDMFGKVMSIPDALMESYYNLLTPKQAWTYHKDVEAQGLHPRDAKKSLAVEIVKSFYGEERAIEESEEFDRIFSERKNPEHPEAVFVSAREVGLADALKKSLAVSTTSEAYRLIRQGGVTVNGQKVLDPKAVIDVTKKPLIKAGKKHFFRLEFKQ